MRKNPIFFLRSFQAQQRVLPLFCRNSQQPREAKKRFPMGANMKKLMILSTGGTIACTQTAEGLIPTLSADDILAYAPEAKRLGKIETKTILNLDSSNIQPEE